jgi:acylglycerol lipase
MLRRAFLASAALLPAACAPTVQGAFRPGFGFGGPRLEEEAFISFDGARLGLTVWPAQGGEPKAVIVALHGMNDYSAAFGLAATAWAAMGITTYAYDQRGYGRSPNRGVWPSEALIFDDLRTMATLVRARHPTAVLAVAGVSMGGAAAMAAFGGDNPPDADRVILLAPAVWGWSTQYLPNATALWLSTRTAPDWVVEPPKFLVKRIKVTDNPDEMRRMSRDPLMLWGARADALYGIVGLMQRAYESAGRIAVPVLYLYGYRDEVIPKTPSFTAAGRLKPSDKTGYYRDGYHLLLSDRQAWRVYADVAGFIRDPRAPLVSGVGSIPKR